jgi:hypothetical protein
MDPALSALYSGNEDAEEKKIEKKTHEHDLFPSVLWQPPRRMDQKKKTNRPKRKN